MWKNWILLRCASMWILSFHQLRFRHNVARNPPLVDSVKVLDELQRRRHESVDIVREIPVPLRISVGCTIINSFPLLAPREDSPIIALGATTAPSKTCLIVPLINSNAAPVIGVKGAGSSAEPSTMSSRTMWLSISGNVWFGAKVMLREWATGARREEMREKVEVVDSRKSMR